MTTKTYPLVCLIVLDGWGLREETQHNAIALGQTPVFDRLWREYPHTTLTTHGREVGLPDGQMGNSEVGHLSLGAGTIVWQDMSRIDMSIVDGSFYKSNALTEALTQPRVHLIGLASDGGVHSMDRHYFALIEMAARLGRRGDDVVIHALSDGRDTPPKAGHNYIRRILAACRKFEVGVLGSVVGRYFAMDRDRRYDRINKAFRALVYGEGELTEHPLNVINERYELGQTDEFIEPIIVKDTPRIMPGDSVIFWNFRPDRGRQLAMALGWKSPLFDRFERGPTFLPAKVTTLTHYRDDFDFPIVFSVRRMAGTLGQIVSEAGMRQLRIAEAEKRAHVTYFFNGGRERAFDKEERVYVPSVRVPTYDMKPEMSAREVTDRVVQHIQSRDFQLVVLNFANTDMVGHTGNLEAAIVAVETVDEMLGRVVEAVLSVGGAALVCADHGNCEQMWDYENDQPHTAHTTNLVPMILVAEGADFELRSGRALSAVAPTACKLLGLRPSPQMSAASLLPWT